MSGAVLVMIGGVWVLCQLFGGNALGRLGLVGEPGDLPPKEPTATDRPASQGGGRSLQGGRI